MTERFEMGATVIIALVERRHLMPPDDKDAAIFPRRFGGDWLLVRMNDRALFLDEIGLFSII